MIDCSEYNPCGSNGYCFDNLNGEWTCTCKFWWNGTICNESELYLLSDVSKTLKYTKNTFKTYRSVK